MDYNANEPHRHILDKTGLFIVRQFDFMEGWCDASEELSWECALNRWNELTDGGTRYTELLNGFGKVKKLTIDADYYRIFPSDTRMIYRVD